MRFYEHMTNEGERWDSIAYRWYGDARRYGPIVEANPEVRITRTLPGGVRLRVPVLDVDTVVSIEELPPWKR